MLFAAGLVLGVGAGIGLILFKLLVPVPLLNLFAIVGVGYIVGEGLSAAVNKKRGRKLMWVAGGSMLLALLPIVIAILIGATSSLYVLLAVGAAFYIAVTRFN